MHISSLVFTVPLGPRAEAANSSSVFRRGGIVPTAICLSKAAIGAGVLSVAAHSAEVGAVYQFVCLTSLGFDDFIIFLKEHCLSFLLLFCFLNTDFVLVVFGLVFGRFFRFGGLLTIISIRMISTAAIETQRWSFEDISEELFHPDAWLR